MLPNTLTELLKLRAEERAEIAMALWQNLTGADREAEFVPGAAIPWEEVRRKLGGEA